MRIPQSGAKFHAINRELFRIFLMFSSMKSESREDGKSDRFNVTVSFALVLNGESDFV